MSIIACPKCRERYGLADEPEVVAPAGEAGNCGFCGAPVEESGPAPDLLDALLSLSVPNSSRTVVSAPRTEGALPQASADAAPGAASPTAPSLGRKVEELTAALVGEERPPNPSPTEAVEPVSALPPVTSVPPSSLVQALLPVASPPVTRSSRDSLDDGWGDPTSGPRAETSAAVAEDDLTSSEAETVPLDLGAEAETVPLDVNRLAPRSATPIPAQAVTAEDDDGEDWTEVPEESLAADSTRAPESSRVPDPSEVLRDATESSPFNGPTPSDTGSESRPWASFGAARTSAFPRLPLPSKVPAEAAQVLSSVSPVVQSGEMPFARQKRGLAKYAAAVAALAAVGLAFMVGLKIGKDNPTRGERTVLSLDPAKATFASQSPAVAATTPASPATAAARPELATKTQAAPAGSVSARPAGKSFSARAANASLATAIGRARACRKAGDPAGVAQIAVSFANNGRVSAVNVAGVNIAGTSLASCIATTLKAARVPAFGGEPVTMKKTMKFK